MNGSLAEWFRSIREFEQENYWPGPRPLIEKDPDDQLVGRDQDVRDIVRYIADNKLFVLSGATGDGKSSLLNKGIRPALTRLGNVVLLCNEWSGTGDDVEDGGEFIRAKLAEQLPPTILADNEFVWALDDLYGARACIVLDQFEELIRHEPQLFARICTWIEDVLRDTQVRIIISLREEYFTRLKAIDAGPYGRRDFVIEPIKKLTTIEQLLRSGRRADGGATIHEDAVERLLSLWTEADGGSRATNIGLLHLQALLYVLWRRSDGAIGITDLDKIQEQLLGDEEFHSARERAVALFQRSLAHVVGLRLELCDTVYRSAEIQGEPTLATGAASLIRRMAGYLSSGGYKVDQDRWHLAELVLDDELTTLGYRSQDERANAAGLFSSVSKVVDRYRGRFTAGMDAARDTVATPNPDDELADYLSAPRADLVGDSQGFEPAGLRDPWETDRREVTGGMMMGATPSETLVEVYRQYFFALEWLEASFLVRQTNRRVSIQQADETTVSLIHDGFGRGLVDWARREEERPGESFGLLIAAVGETFLWEGVIDGAKDGSYRYAVNLRWKSCLVTAAFHNMTFVNCDFRNSTFVDCEFMGVTFVNCLLDGVSFSNAAFRGDIPRLPQYTEKEKKELASAEFDLLSFSLPLPPVGQGIIRSLARYRETPDATTATTLYSLTSGLPATPSKGEIGYEVPTIDGGLAMYGGRLSSLVFVGCTFPDEGRIALRDIAGTSLEFAEQAVGRIELRNVALRGLTISAPLDYQRADGDGVDLFAYFSVLQNVWISARVPGTAEIDDCGVWQIANGSRDFTVGTSESGVQGRLDPNDEGMSALEATSTKVDYRSIPAKRELTLRRRKA